MIKNFSKKAFTLIELIVSTVLVAIVSLGIITIHMVLSNNNQDYGQKYLVRSSTQITLNHILNDASMAVGTGEYVVGTPAVLDQGILIGTQMGAANNNSFCIHQQSSAGVDSWVCYWLDTTASDPTYQQISYCTKSYLINDASGYRGAESTNSCQAGTTQFLGTAYSITNLIVNGVAQPTPTYVQSQSQVLFSITIQNCLNNTLSSCNSTGISTDPEDNPEVQISGSVIPPQVTS